MYRHLLTRQCGWHLTNGRARVDEALNHLPQHLELIASRRPRLHGVCTGPAHSSPRPVAPRLEPESARWSHGHDLHVRRVGNLRRKIEEADPDHFGEHFLSLLGAQFHGHTNWALCLRPVNLAAQRLTRERPIPGVELISLMAMRVLPHELKNLTEAAAASRATPECRRRV
jgi:hypothetical protein